MKMNILSSAWPSQATKKYSTAPNIEDHADSVGGSDHSISNEDRIKPVGSSVNRYASFYHVYFLGICLTIGGIHFGWNSGLRYGFGEYMIALTLVTSGYLALVLCSGEMTSVLPFSGGSYGFARVTLGPYLGFIVGCCDALRCLIYIIRRVVVIGLMLQEIFGTDPKYQSLYWLLVFIPAVLLDFTNSRTFWSLILLFGAVSLLLTVLYLLSGASQMNFDKYGMPPGENDFTSGMVGFLTIFPSNNRLYQGIATLPLCCEESKHPKHDVPRAMVLVTITVFIMAVCIAFASVSQSPGLLGLQKVSVSFPLQFGYSQSMSISEAGGLAFSLPSLFATAFGFAYSYGRIIAAMGRSGLVPSIVTYARGERQNPYSAMIFGSCLVFIFMCGIYYGYFDDPYHQTMYFNAVYAVSLYTSTIVFWSCFASFCMMRYSFQSLEKQFTNPFGIPSAIWGSIIFAVPCYYVLAYTNYNVASVIIFVVFITLCTIYYYGYAIKTQCYSADEQSIMLVLYVMKANRMKRKRMVHHKFTKAGHKKRASVSSYRVTDTTSGAEMVISTAPTNSEVNGGEGRLPAVTPTTTTGAYYQTNMSTNTLIENSNSNISDLVVTRAILDLENQTSPPQERVEDELHVTRRLS